MGSITWVQSLRPLWQCESTFGLLPQMVRGVVHVAAVRRASAGKFARFVLWGRRWICPRSSASYPSFLLHHGPFLSLHLCQLNSWCGFKSWERPIGHQEAYAEVSRKHFNLPLSDLLIVPSLPLDMEQHIFYQNSSTYFISMASSSVMVRLTSWFCYVWNFWKHVEFSCFLCE